MLSIRIVTTNETRENQTSTREINELFKSLLDSKNKEIRMGKYSEKVSEIISIQVFDRNQQTTEN